MRFRRHLAGRAVVSLSVATGLFVAPVSARRLAVVVTDAPVFVVTLNGDDDASVDCSGGNVRVIANGSPTVYTTACAAVTSLTVTAAGTFFTHTINLTSVTAVDFPALASPHIIGSSDDDTIIGSPLPDLIDAGQGDDDIFGLSGADIINADIGDDVIRGGTGNDIIDAGPNLDQLDWAPGDGDDTFDGGADGDNLAFDGSAANDTFTIAPSGPGFVISLAGGGSVAATNVESLSVRSLGADDVVNTTGLPSTAQNLDGGAQTVADTLNVISNGLCVDIGSSPMNLPGSQPIAFVDFEATTAPCSVPAMPPALLFVLGAGLAALMLAGSRKLSFA